MSSSLDGLRTAVEELRALPRHAVALTESELTEAVQYALAIVAHAEASVVSLTAEALERGTVDRSTAAGPTQRIGRLAAGESAEEVIDPDHAQRSGPLLTLAPTAAAESARTPLSQAGIEPGRARTLAVLAEATRRRDNAPIRDALLDAQTTPSVARTALDNVEKVTAVLPNATRSQVFGYFLQLPPGSGARTVHELTRRLIDRFGREGALDHNEEVLEQHESVTFTPLPCGMTRMIADLSPDHTEILRTALTALSAPAPATSCCADPHHRHAPGSQTTADDARTPAKRRADALMLLLAHGSRSVDEAGGVHTHGSARLVVTIDYAALSQQLRGAGVTDHDTAMTPATVRQLACEAEVLPMVLASRSEPLDVGRTQRLVTGSLRRAVIQRDRHCTFPGCGRPPSWCQVHHVRPWWSGGETSLANSALLCQSHHTQVHRHGFTATVHDRGVRWDLSRHRPAAQTMRSAS
ncbi:DUF222 domain-containing protein [Dermacoccaceae bacterium W4C1]